MGFLDDLINISQILTDSLFGLASIIMYPIYSIFSIFIQFLEVLYQTAWTFIDFFYDLISVIWNFIYSPIYALFPSTVATAIGVVITTTIAFAIWRKVGGISIFGVSLGGK